MSLRSRSSSPRSVSDRSLSGARPDSLALFTHLPNVISWTPILLATSAIDRARIEVQANGLVPVLLGKVSACRHAISSAG